MIKKGIIFGPWVGEFGWELFSWQAYCRSISRNFDVSIAISRPGNNFLYDDFCDLFIPYEPHESGIVDSHTNSAMTDFNVIEFLRSTVPDETLQLCEWNWLKPQKIGHPPYDHWRSPVNVHGFGDIIPEYKLYRNMLEENIDIVIHARNRKIRETDNWNVSRWNDLVSMFPNKTKIACIGSDEESIHLNGTLDARGVSLDKTIGILSGAKCILGPSSGPMHLASLTGCPQVVWTSNPSQNFSRYKYCWNPFFVDVDVIKTSDPSPEDVYRLAERYIDITKIVEKHIAAG